MSYVVRPEGRGARVRERLRSKLRHRHGTSMVGWAAPRGCSISLPRLLLGIATACSVLASTGLSAQPIASCDAHKAQFALGQRYSPELAERAGRAAGARHTRKLEPGAPATTDLREDRLNLQLDRQETVSRVTCG
jgi:hypothetical protein